jgi:hypothetical protein
MTHKQAITNEIKAVNAWNNKPLETFKPVAEKKPAGTVDLGCYWKPSAK